MLEVDYDSLMNAISSLESYLEEYNSHISDMKTLSDKVNSSDDWIDTSVKPLFINYLNSYIEIFNSCEKALNDYINFLRIKANNFNEHENKFS